MGALKLRFSQKEFKFITLITMALNFQQVLRGEKAKSKFDITTQNVIKFLGKTNTCLRLSLIFVSTDIENATSLLCRIC